MKFCAALLLSQLALCTVLKPSGMPTASAAARMLAFLADVLLFNLHKLAGQPAAGFRTERPEGSNRSLKITHPRLQDRSFQIHALLTRFLRIDYHLLRIIYDIRRSMNANSANKKIDVNTKQSKAIAREDCLLCIYAHIGAREDREDVFISGLRRSIVLPDIVAQNVLARWVIVEDPGVTQVATKGGEAVVNVVNRFTLVWPLVRTTGSGIACLTSNGMNNVR